MSQSVTVEGREFRLADDVPLKAIIRFARAAVAGISTSDLAGLAAIDALCEEAIHPDDWAAFDQYTDEIGADGDTMIGVIRDAISVLAVRPTKRSTDSSDGPPATVPTSLPDSSETESSTPLEGIVSPLRTDPRIATLKPIREAAAEFLAG